MALSAEGDILEFNPEAENLFGKKKEKVLHCNYVDLFVPEKLRDQVKKQMGNIFKKEDTGMFKSIVKGSQDKMLTIQWAVNNLIDNNGQFSGFIIVGQNITPYEKE